MQLDGEEETKTTDNMGLGFTNDDVENKPVDDDNDEDDSEYDNQVSTRKTFDHIDP